jgi:hypothetical protein
MVVTGVCCVCTIAGSVVFFCSEILCFDVVVVGGDGAGVVHPATSITMHSALTTIKKIFCINPAKWKRAIKVLLLFEMERKFARYLGECDGSGEIPDKKSGHERGLHQSCLRLPRV